MPPARIPPTGKERVLGRGLASSNPSPSPKEYCGHFHPGSSSWLLPLSAAWSPGLK